MSQTYNELKIQFEDQLQKDIDYIRDVYSELQKDINYKYDREKVNLDLCFHTEHSVWLEVDNFADIEKTINSQLDIDEFKKKLCYKESLRSGYSVIAVIEGYEPNNENIKFIGKNKYQKMFKKYLTSLVFKEIAKSSKNARLSQVVIDCKILDLFKDGIIDFQQLVNVISKNCEI